MDPEELHALFQAYQQSCAADIARFEGSIARYLGDGILVYFGYPQAHEDDAERAVRAALAIVESMVGLTARLGRDKGVEFGVRIGIATGLVVVGDFIGQRVCKAWRDPTKWWSLKVRAV